ncbi:MAG: glyoxalase [Actinobacteria bacterium]|nr:glyoxalase [Actinomycetota bacterium]
MIESIDHVQLAAPPGCEEQARRFFGDLVGLEEIPKPGALTARGGVWFRCGLQELHIGVEPDFSPARKAHPAFRVRALDDLRIRLESAGTATREDAAGIPGLRRFHVDDPWGNRLEFVEAA